MDKPNFRDTTYRIDSLIGKPKPERTGCLLAIDFEDDTKGTMRCAHVFGEVNVLSHLTPTGKVSNSKAHRKIINVDRLFVDTDELYAFLNSLDVGDVKEGKNVTTLVGYNLGYDFVYFLDIIETDQLLMSGTKLISGRLINGMPIIDLFNHGGGKSLDSWITSLHMGDKGIVKTEFSPDMTFEELCDHCRNDTRATWELGEFFKETYYQMGVSFRQTTSSNALELFKRKFLTRSWERDIVGVKSKSGLSLNDMERQSYYGGRTECFSRGIHYTQGYDINSAYVAAMRDHTYPEPRYAVYHENDKGFQSSWKSDEIMIIHCAVTAPKSRVMVLPWRDPKDGKLLFPWGKFSGWWTSPELHAAVKYGYTIDKVYEYILYNKSEPVFRQYAIYTYQQRLNAVVAGNEGMKNVWKLLGNGLYGKIGQHVPKNSKITFNQLPNVSEDTLLDEYPFNGGIVYIVTDTDKVDSSHTFPCIPALITTYTRLDLLQYLKRHEEDVIYCDTDSIKYPADSPPEVHSEDLGGVKYETDQHGHFCFLRPKVYGRANANFLNFPDDYDFLTSTTILGTNIEIDISEWKTKGLGKAFMTHYDPEKMTITAYMEKPSRFKEALRRGMKPNLWGAYKKVLSVIDDKRLWFGKDSEPLYINNCEE